MNAGKKFRRLSKRPASMSYNCTETNHRNHAALPRRVIKGIRVKSLESLEPLKRYQDIVSAFLLDTYAPDMPGGTGQVIQLGHSDRGKKIRQSNPRRRAHT